jgi:ketosteroid isomerase-like protein
MEAPGAHLWTFRDGLVVRYQVFRDRDEARAALES